MLLAKGAFFMSKKVLGIIEGAVVIALGVLIAIFGGQAVMDIYFGVLFVIAGAILLAFGIATLIKTKLLSFGITFGAVAALLFGSLLLARLLSIDFFFYVLVWLIVAAGGALVLYGIYTIVKLSVFYGIGQIVVGAAASTLGLCYLYVEGFAKVFWIIIGVLVAVYGVFMVLSTIFAKEEKKTVEAE